jgi:vitamin B12 transporter
VERRFGRPAAHLSVTPTVRVDRTSRSEALRTFIADARRRAIMPRHHHRAALAALFLASPTAAMAADDPQVLVADAKVSEVVVTPTRAAGGVDPATIGGSLSVITPGDFEDRQVRIVSDVLRDVPGVSVGRTGGFGSLTELRVRGSESNQTLVLVDGIEASDPFFGFFDWGTVLADDLARMEVLRGQQSALYGSDAIGGVINYTTPSGREAPGLRIRAEGGSMATFGTAARAAGVESDLDYVVSGAYQTTDGFVVAPGGSRKIGSSLSSIGGKASYALTPDLTLRAVVRHTKDDADQNGQDFGTTGFALDSPGATLKARTTYGLAAADLSLLGGRWTHSLTIQGVDAVRDTTSNFVRDGGDKGTRGKGSYVTSLRIDQGMATHKLTLAIDRERESFQNTAPPDPFGPDLTRRSVTNTGYVGEYDWTLGERAGFGAALRYDKNDQFDDATTYRVQGYYRINDRLRVRAAAGSGIKNPNQVELFGFNAGVFPFQGNPDLKPEKSKGWEAGADFALLDGRLKLGATWFDSTLHDEIITVFGAVTTTANATTHSTRKGIELFADGRLSDAWRLDAAYTHLDAEQNGSTELRRPKDIASLNLTWKPTDKASMTLTTRYNGKALDTEFATFSTVTLKAFTLVNLAGAYRITDRVEAFGRIENLFDRDYQEVFGYLTPGRAAYAGLRARF